ncbi:hypothetical protein HS088_TW07G00931 [Tripterygium wilfordii]|uniref:Phospholipase-like protein n=2 Tax=Tripterygium wilfordii TaxID=458696 RepID=A0A7J7DG56_TRIWF|nr:uncharacterized protein LOC120002073 isoform X2 [Tripterygium wilfordii]KAF5745347.1 hypothetical protein HS088_TW07G00931 [Tripterygium wilfordii]
MVITKFGNGVHKEMAGYQKSHPECVNAANPYHECGTACLEKIAEGKGRKDNRKKTDDPGGTIEGSFTKKKDGGKNVQPTCIKASNPFHECDELCFKKTVDGKSHWQAKGSILSFGRKKKGSDSQPLTPRSGFESQPMTPRNGFESQPLTPRNGFDSQPKTPRNGTDSCSIKPPALEKVPAKNAANPDFSSPRSHFSFQWKNDESYSSTDHEIYSRDQSLDKAKVQSSLSVPASGTITPDHPKEATRDGNTFVATAIPTATEMDKKLGSSETVYSSICEDAREFTSDPVVQSSKSLDHSDPPKGGATFLATTTPTTQEKDAKDMRDHTSNQNARSMKFTFSGISRASEDSDEEEVQPEISHVLVGKYHVKASVASILRSIFDKHGDIAANCHLESAAMRAYYLESVCSVVQELRFASYTQIPKSKVKGMLAVLKDVESAKIDVSWLHRLLNEIVEAKELVNEHQAVEAAKANCDCTLESTRKELESLMEDIARKEKELAEAQARVAETKARLGELEVESSQLSQTMSSLHSKIEKFRGKSLEDQLL